VRRQHISGLAGTCIPRPKLETAYSHGSSCKRSSHECLKVLCQRKIFKLYFNRVSASRDWVEVRYVSAVGWSSRPEKNHSVRLRCCEAWAEDSVCSCSRHVVRIAWELLEPVGDRWSGVRLSQVFQNIIIYFWLFEIEVIGCRTCWNLRPWILCLWRILSSFDFCKMISDC